VAGNSAFETSGAMSLLDGNAFFDGVLHTTRDLRIDGEYRGEIHCEGQLTIAESAQVSGQVHASAITLAGVLDGEVECQGKFELLPSARASANVVAGSVVIHPGAQYEGDLRMREAPEGLSPREATITSLPRRAQNTTDSPARQANER
jgi:cytoskeletal protein CcmA (bactofilin family)